MIVAGFGFRKSASVASLRDAYARATGRHDVSCLATISDKAESDLFQTFAEGMGLPVQAVDQEEIGTVCTLTESQHARAARETGSVAEATALLAAGPGAKIIERRVVSSDRLATCAIASSRAVGDER